MKLVVLFFIQLATGLWRSPHRFVRYPHDHHQNVIFLSSPSETSSSSLPAVVIEPSSSSTTTFTNNHGHLVDNLRTSKPLYQFILTFPERARKELSFSLFVEYDFASFLFGVLRFNRRAQWSSSFSDEMKTIIYQYIELDILATSNEQVTRYVDILWCLGKLSSDFNSQPDSLQSAIFNKLITLEPASIGREVSRVLYSLSLMQLCWVDIPPSPHRALLQLLTMYLPTMNVIEVVNSVYALGRMGCLWSTLPKPLYQELLVHVQRSVSSSGVISISNLLW